VTGPRLWIVVPSYGGIEAPTTLALVGLSGIWSAAGGTVHMLTAGGPIIGLLRDELTASLMGKGVEPNDVVFWLDADMSFDAPELVRWLDRVPHGAIVGVAGRKKQDPPVYCCELDDDPALAVPLPAHLSHLRVGTVGGACLAMRGSTLGRLWDTAAPYVLGHRQLREVWRCGVFLTSDAVGSTPRRQFWGEDTGLCLLARSAGVAVLIDPTVWLGHHDGRICYGGRLADGLGHTMDGRTVAEALSRGPAEYRAFEADNAGAASTPQSAGASVAMGGTPSPGGLIR
jgi:hypothetical protein